MQFGTSVNSTDVQLQYYIFKIILFKTAFAWKWKKSLQYSVYLMLILLTNFKQKGNYI